MFRCIPRTLPPLSEVEGLTRIITELPWKDWGDCSQCCRGCGTDRNLGGERRPSERLDAAELDMLVMISFLRFRALI